MKTIRSGKRLRSDGGQVTITVVLAMGIFLLGAMGFAVDMANLWFHRQSAQTAADAACTAGAMDLLVDATNGATSQGGFNPKSGAFTCSGSPSTAPCQYAALNGYNGANTAQGNDVQVSFPGSVSGVTAPDATLAPSPFIRVDVIDHAQVFFSALLSGRKTQDVRATAICGLVQANAPVPLIVLKPTCAATLGLQGAGTVSIIGGPSRSIEVNSNNSNAVSTGGSSATINLSNGGPAFTGSDLGTWGGPSTPVTGFSAGSTGKWLYPASPIDDPYAKVPAPTQPAACVAATGCWGAAPAPTAVAYHTHGCPDGTGSPNNNLPSVMNTDNTLALGNIPLITGTGRSTPGCVLFHPGLYDQSIKVKGYTAIFQPGLYYFRIPVGTYDSETCGTADGVCNITGTGGCNYALAVNSGGVVRPSATTGVDAGDGSYGVTFYLSGPGGTGGYGSVFFGSSSGSVGGSTILDPWNWTPTDGTGASCPGGAAPNGSLGLSGPLAGDILVGPCTKDGTYFASPSNASSVGPVRGMIFFQDRNDGDNHGQPSMQGGGGLLMSGTMYFHHCPNSPSCNPSTDYKAFLQFQGHSGASTYLLGNITTDELLTGGGGSVKMQLDPAYVYSILKVALLK